MYNVQLCTRNKRITTLVPSVSMAWTWRKKCANIFKKPLYEYALHFGSGSNARSVYPTAQIGHAIKVIVRPAQQRSLTRDSGGCSGGRSGARPAYNGARLNGPSVLVCSGLGPWFRASTGPRPPRKPRVMRHFGEAPPGQRHRDPLIGPRCPRS